MALTTSEDADLRRLASFDRIGFLDVRGQTRLHELRARDRRTVVRDVDESVENLAPLRYGGRPLRGATCAVYPV
ncbi:MAG: hypothetical protein ACJ735_10895 [Actinomycetes bacterium]